MPDDVPRYVRFEEIGILPAGATEDMLKRASHMIERRVEEQRMRALGVDPERVIEGETVQSVQEEIES